MNTQNDIRSIGVIGAGAWGTALAAVAARNGLETRLWAREPEVAKAINASHINTTFLPGIPLPDTIEATQDIADLAGCEAVLLVTPAQFMRPTLRTARAHLVGGTPLVICAKGIERDTGALMSEVVAEDMPGYPVAVLSGPTFAGEVARGLPAAVTLAAADETQGQRLIDALGGPAFRPYYAADVIGAQIGGAVKNVLAVACGMVAGLGLGENARAALITRGLAEMVRFGSAMGAERETMIGLSGVGDLILTCSSEQSRNMSLGMAIGAGQDVKDVLAGRSSVAEGVFTAAILVRLAKETGVDMPIAGTVHAVLEGDAEIGAAVDALMRRPYKREDI